MARQTRAQRRARREQQGEAARREQQPDGRRDQQPAAALPQRARGRQPAQLSTQSPDREPEARRPPGSGGRRFVAESWGELQKVEWPGQRQVMQGTVVVLIACAIVGTYLWGADLVLKRLVQNILLGQ